MGDERRHKVFTDLLVKNFPVLRYPNVLVIADGKGRLARSLANKGYRVRVVENCPRFEGQEHYHIRYQKGWFSWTDEVLEKLIVAMHPDEATAEVIKAGKKNNVSWAVVPCCRKGLEAHGVGNYTAWLKKLSSLDSDVAQVKMKMNGKNIALIKRR